MRILAKYQGRSQGMFKLAVMMVAAVSLVETAAAAQNSAETKELEEIVVRGKANFAYREATSALKVPLSIKDTPQTVLALTEDMLDFASINTWQDIYKVDPSGATTHRTDNFVVNYFRGFRQQTNNAVRIDGFRLKADIGLDFAAFERLELVKGATSTMYGQNAVAGTLNAITKKPRDEFGGRLAVESGSFNHNRVDFDIYGPLTASRSLTGRLVAAYMDEDSHLDYAGRQVRLISPSLKYEFTPDTSIVAVVNYQEIDVVGAWAAGLQYMGDLDDGFANGFDPSLFQIPDVPRSHFWGADWQHSPFTALTTHTTLEHNFSNDWVLRANLQYGEYDLYPKDITSGYIRADGTPNFTSLSENNNSSDINGAEVNLFGDVEMFGRMHTLFFGIDSSEIETGLIYQSGPPAVARPSMNDPAFNTAVPPISSPSDYSFYFDRRLVQRDTGFTAQVFLRPTDRLTVLLGARYSDDEQKDFRKFDPADPYNVQEFRPSETTLQTGLTYALTDAINVYASYGQTFEPQTGQIAQGTLIDPEEGDAYEIGVKGEVGDRLLYSAAAFNMTRSNISEGVPGTPFVAPLGTQRSRGLEFELQGTMVPGWEIFGSLSLMDAEFIDGQFEGYRPEGAPKFGLSVFTSYEFQEGTLQGFGVGGGIVHKAGRESFFTAVDTDGLPLTYDFGDYTELDLRVYYRKDRWRFEVAATNLLDELYYTPATNNFGFAVHPNPARSVIGKVSHEFGN